MSNRIRLAIVGVGNCCSALVQGIRFYSSNPSDLPHHDVGGYLPANIDIVAAFDIDERKVGEDLSQAIFSEPNNFKKICEVKDLGVTVQMGHILDGAEGMLNETIKGSGEKQVDVARVLIDRGAEVLVSFLPTGVDQASRFYAEEALKAGCAFINAAPSPIVNNKLYVEKFEKARLPLIGDDVMSQIGGTVFHKNILEFLFRRGVKVKNTYQLDVGGGTETYNTLERSRNIIKRRIKTETIKSSLPYEAEIVAGTTDYVKFLENMRTSYFCIEGKYFLETPVKIDIYMETTDAPNSGSIIMDSIRAAKLALDRGVGGTLDSVCAYGYKRPPMRVSTIEAEDWFNEFIEGKRDR